MSDIAIRVENLSKCYRIGGKQEKYRTLRDTLAEAAGMPIRVARALLGRDGRRRSGTEEFWALKDISFEVKRGEVVGIIGRNGAGKSTLLKILSRITEPTAGYAEIHGRVGSLLEVGTGFHAELSGRENIYLNGAILGMRRAEIERKFDEIVAFAEVEKFIDTPVKHYSSGMYLRLAFAVAAHLEPEILLVDEVLAVGDAAFQKKCLGKMQDVAEQGRTVLFVSHNMAAISALCSRCVLLDQGVVVQDGQTESVLQRYSTLGYNRAPLGQRVDREGSGALRFIDIEFQAPTSEPLAQIRSGMDIRLVLRYQAPAGELLRNVDAAVFFNGPLGELFFVCIAHVVREPFASVAPEGWLVCHIPRLPLPPGTYTIGLWSQVGKTIADRIDNAVQVEVAAGDFYDTGRLPAYKHRAVLIDYAWSVEPVVDVETESGSRASAGVRQVPICGQNVEA